MTGKVQLNKGKIRDNALKALVKSNLFRHKVERKRKGKGSYNRQEAKKWRDGVDTVPSFYCPFTDGCQTWKLSPQPHESLTLGFSNLKPSCKPSLV